MKTQMEVKKLKEDWLEDPSWDLAKTEGFEEHEIELEIFEDQQRKKWKDQRLDYLNRRDHDLGVRIECVEMIDKLISEVSELREKSQRIEEEINSLRRRKVREGKPNE